MDAFEFRVGDWEKARIIHRRLDRAVGHGLIERRRGYGLPDTAAQLPLLFQGDKGRPRPGDILRHLAEVRHVAGLQISFNRPAGNFQQTQLQHQQTPMI